MILDLSLVSKKVLVARSQVNRAESSIMQNVSQ